MSRGRTRILFSEDAARAVRYRGAEVVIYVRGVRELHGEVAGRGARIVREIGERPWGTLDFTVEDPDGMKLIFTEAPDQDSG